MNLFNIIDVLNYILFAAGLLFCVRAFIKKKSLGYLVLSIYFILSLLLTGAARIVHTYVDKQRLTQAQNVQTQEGIPVPTKNVSLPIMPLILVVGVGLIIKEDLKRNKDSNV